MLVLCSKGCGVAINVTEEMVTEAKAAGVPIDAQHEVCPNEVVAVLRDFKITVTVEELVDREDAGDGPEGIWEKVASVGATVQAHTFTEAVPKLGTELNTQWNTVLGMASVIDAQDGP